MIASVRSWFTPFRVATVSWLASIGFSIAEAVLAPNLVFVVVWVTAAVLELSVGLYNLARARAHASLRGSARVEISDFQRGESERVFRDPTRRLERATRRNPKPQEPRLW